MEKSKAAKLVQAFLDKKQEVEKLTELSQQAKCKVDAAELEYDELEKNLADHPTIAPMLLSTGIKTLDNRVIKLDNDTIHFQSFENVPSYWDLNDE